MTKSGIVAYYRAVCRIENITPLPIKFERVKYGGAALVYNAKTMTPVYIKLDLQAMMDPERAILHELTHQIKLETEGDPYIGKRDKSVKFRKLENRLINTYMYSTHSTLIWKNPK